MSQTSWTTFGPDQPWTTLNKAMQRCLPPYADTGGVRPAGCDAIIGSAVTGQGFCAQAPFNQMTYCACVNASPGFGGCPMVASKACADSPHAYMPSRWFVSPGPGADTPYNTCVKNPICINYAEVGGANNVVTGVTQQCGDVTNITTELKLDPSVYFVALLLLVILLGLILAPTTEGAAPPATGGALPAPRRAGPLI
jgi:hypothetical protein